MKARLCLLSFLEFFIWGSWLVSAGGYMGQTLHFSGQQIGNIYGTIGVGSLIMPGLTGLVADRWINGERVLGACHLMGAAALYFAPKATTYPVLYLLLLGNAMFFMPTIALSNAVAFEILQQERLDSIKAFPSIRIWGTVGFVVAMWIVDLLRWAAMPYQFYLASLCGFILGLYCFTLPHCRPSVRARRRRFLSFLGLDAFGLFKKREMLVFFIFCPLLGAVMQIANAFCGLFISDFSAAYQDTFAVRHPNLLLSISQISEIAFILTIPFFMKRVGIKRVMLMSLTAWVFRFVFFAIGNPGTGLIFLVLSMIVYGMAFDFFTISGSLFVERQTDQTIRASSQGLFMLLYNGVGAYCGGFLSGRVVDHFTTAGVKNWEGIWFTFAGYALLLSVTFFLLFHYQEQEKRI
jgi:MFS transporter, NHS family, xanthosine permease